MRGLHLNGIFSQESQNWDSYCPETLDIHILLKTNFFWEHVKAMSNNPQKNISNGV